KPVVNPSANNNHRTSIRINRILGKFSSDFNDQFFFYTRNLLLPTRGKWNVIVVTFSNLAANSAINSIVSKDKIVYCCIVHILATSGRDFVRRNVTVEDFLPFTGKIWHVNLDNIFLVTEHR